MWVKLGSEWSRVAPTLVSLGKVRQANSLAGERSRLRHSERRSAIRIDSVSMGTGLSATTPKQSEPGHLDQATYHHLHTE